MTFKSFIHPQGKSCLYWCWISGALAVLLAFMSAEMAVTGHWWDFSFDVAVGILNTFNSAMNFIKYQEWKMSQPE